MQKVIDIVVTIFLLAAAVAFWLLGGNTYLSMKAGTMAVGEEGIAPHMFCFLTSVLSLLIFIYRLIKSRVNEGKKDATIEDGSAGMNRFLARQGVWLKEWCEYSYNREKRVTYLWVAGIALVLSGIGIAVKYPIRTVLTFHLPLGLFFGEVITVVFWPLISLRNNWKKILKWMKKSLRKQMNSAEKQEEYFTDYFETNSEEELIEKGKNFMCRVTVGAKFWTYMMQSGVITIVDYRELEHIETFEEIITVRVNNVRTTTYHYVAEFFNRDENPKKKLMERYSFETRATLNSFIKLVQERNEDQVLVTDVGTKRI